MVLTSDQKVFLVSNYGSCPTIAKLRSSFFGKYGFKPSYSTVHLLWAKFQESGSVAHKKVWPTTVFKDSNEYSENLGHIQADTNAIAESGIH
jgi:hypothetical protein